MTAARARVHELPISDAALEQVTERCYRARVEGVRADLAMLRAARAHAAWHGRAAITSEDIDAVAELALAHRAPSPSDPGPSGGAGGGEGSRAADGAGAGDRSHDGDRGALSAVPVRAVMPPQQAFERGAASPSSARAPSKGRGGRAPASSRIDWPGTLVRLRLGRERNVRYRRSRAPAAVWIIALDSSASMLRAGALARAKGVATALVRRARRAQARVVLIRFGGMDAAIHERSPSGLARAIGDLGGGGGTPLARALERAFAVIARPSLRAVADKRLYVLTDGRSREPVARRSRSSAGLHVVVVDCERTRLRLGRTRAIANAIGGRYVHIDALFGSGASGVVALPA